MVPLLPLMLTLVQAQATGPARYDHSAAPVINAVRVREPIRVDGRLDEAAWQRAAPATGFRQYDPAEGEPPTEPTEVRVLIDGNAVYIGARLFDSRPDAIRATLARRDQSVDSDIFEVFIDGYHDHLTAARFRVNPAGAIRDALIGANGEDTSWDPVWDYATQIDSLGWTAELRIPLSQLRYNASSEAVWGMQFARLVYRKGETTFFPFVPKTESFGPNRYGHVVGLGAVQAQRQVELMPYTSARAELKPADPANPFRSGEDLFGSAGLDLKYGITSDLTLDATFNPDFGQVEVDPAVVNLSAFETFFSERRPFFIEGADLFRFGQMRTYNRSGAAAFFFSRRIGRPPQLGIGAGPDRRFPDVPSQTTIAGAAKLTGRTASGWSVGILEGITLGAEGRYLDSLGVEQTLAVEPLTNYGVARVRRDLRGGATSVGMMATAVNRDLDDPRFEPVLRSSAYTVGFDFQHAWANRSWSLDGNVAASTVRGSASAVERVQRSSARYYQRPDREAPRLDPTRTSLSGYNYQLSLARTSGTHWLGSLTWQETSPGFEVNDLGFQSTAERRALAWTIGYQDTKPHKVMRNWSVWPFGNYIWNFDGDLLFQSYSALAFGRFSNFWSWFTRFDWQPEVTDDRLTRGGPLARRPTQFQVVAELSTDSRKTTQLDLEAFYTWDVADGYFWNGEVGFSARPTPATRVQVGPELSRSRRAAQYVMTVPSAAATETFGARYVFAGLEQTELSMNTRLDWTFTPRLSFQLFMQPLISAVDFGAPKELARPGTFAFDVYGVDQGTVQQVPGGLQVSPGDGGTDFFVPDLDFNFRSLRGNAVLRWEYRPGSTLFVIWQRSTTDLAQGVGNFDFGRDVGRVFSGTTENVFAVKLSYWLGL